LIILIIKEAVRIMTKYSPITKRSANKSGEAVRIMTKYSPITKRSANKSGLTGRLYLQVFLVKFLNIFFGYRMSLIDKI
jgi:hypothetical protein